jgi:hypothetical protein
MLAVKYLADDPGTCLLKLRQFGEYLGQTVAARMCLYKADGGSQFDTKIWHQKFVHPRLKILAQSCVRLNCVPNWKPLPPKPLKRRQR